MKKKNLCKTLLKTMCIVLGILILALLAYIVYLYASYYRIEDNQELVVEAPVDDTTTGAAAVLATDTEYSAVTYNIGFGAYLPDYSFFMDGGTSSWAESPETVQYAINGAGELVKSLDPDFALIQEIDLDATRSYHTDEYEMLRNILPEYTTVFAQNYDSAFLFYPFTQPHGSSRAGLGLFSKYPVSSALRRSFPISTSFSKFFDLDRCYSVSRIPVDNGKELVIFNLHMSAYGNSDAIRQGQIEMLCNDMAKEYEAGNYVLCGGDFNHDLKASEKDTESCESWAFPFPRSELPEHFTFCLDLLTEEEQAALWNSARNADMEYVPGVTYTVTLDGFIISDNIECLSYENVNTGYSYSDHDPVKVEFMLK